MGEVRVNGWGEGMILRIIVVTIACMRVKVNSLAHSGSDYYDNRVLLAIIQ